MASLQTALNYMSKALWDPNPTHTDAQARHLAAALGYPVGWRVVRTMEYATTNCSKQQSVGAVKDEESRNAHAENNVAMNQAGATTPAEPIRTIREPMVEDLPLNHNDAGTNGKKEPSSADVKQETVEARHEARPAHNTSFNGTENSTTASANGTTDIATNPSEALARTMPESTQPMEQTILDNSKVNETTDTTQNPAAIESICDEPETMQPHHSNNRKVRCIVDRIYTGPPGNSDMFYNHQAASEAAATWDPEQSTPFDYHGGHLLPRQPLFQKGDAVQVQQPDDDDTWWDAVIARRTKTLHSFKYQVQYTDHGASKQTVEEEALRYPPHVQDPKLTASKLGFGDGWSATVTAGTRYKIKSPDGTVYTSKKKAWEAYQETLQQTTTTSVGDPPWRTTGSDYLGRTIEWKATHAISSRRLVEVVQRGTVVGWIRETDVDKAGQPGFVSEASGEPARLYHVVFDAEPNHPYPSLQAQSQDLEEYELQACLLPETKTTDDARPAKKKAKPNAM
jgi:hypothetical protein